MIEWPYCGFLKLKKGSLVPVWGFVIFCKRNILPLEEFLPQPVSHSPLPPLPPDPRISDFTLGSAAVPQSVPMETH